jgi:acyl CoA:acetate/3-ketoacid CoA transferase alpha subunit
METVEEAVMVLAERVPAGVVEMEVVVTKVGGMEEVRSEVMKEEEVVAEDLVEEKMEEEKEVHLEEVKMGALMAAVAKETVKEVEETVEVGKGEEEKVVVH